MSKISKQEVFQNISGNMMEIVSGACKNCNPWHYRLGETLHHIDNDRFI